jgi:hypothetical protein
MRAGEPVWLQHQRQRWLRPDAERYLRPDAARWMRSDLLQLFQPPPCERKYRPDQPRVPAGNPDGGQWTSEGEVGAGSIIADRARDRGSSRSDLHLLSDATPDNDWKPGAQYAAARNRRPGIGHNQGPPLNEPPPVPETAPPTERERNNFLKAAAQYLVRAARAGGPVGVFIAAMEAASWLDTDRAFIDAARDPPKTFEELQQAVSSKSMLGYNDHHVVEQTPAYKDGFPRFMIDAPENLARIPTLKHWEITAWYGTKNFSEKYGGLSPREYLRGRDWEERMSVGREALILHGVLKP